MLQPEHKVAGVAGSEPARRVRRAKRDAPRHVGLRPGHRFGGWDRAHIIGLSSVISTFCRKEEGRGGKTQAAAFFFVCSVNGRPVGSCPFSELVRKKQAGRGALPCRRKEEPGEVNVGVR